MNKINYHLDELAVARNSSDPRHNMPVIPDECRSLLDVGCGAGQTLMDLDPKRISLFGLDIDLEALELGRQLTSAINYVNGSVDHIPFKDNSFDMVISRVTLPLTDIPHSLESIHKVLRPAGLVWMSLHSLSMQKKLLLDSLASRKIKASILHIYALLNGFFLHFLGKTYHFPLRPKRFQSFQSPKGMTKILSKIGFENILVTKNGIHLNITAMKKRK